MKLSFSNIQEVFCGSFNTLSRNRAGRTFGVPTKKDNSSIDMGVDYKIESVQIESSNNFALPKQTKILLKSLLIWCLVNIQPSESRGGGSKRTFSSKSQNSQNQQNLGKLQHKRI